ncbi:uncharacterized protein LOC123682722 isoform X2 [Harmonia axyridis]|uniref:uncharacterized protein LOC123682722 isoform X2 n=1 Tax=Harmonia axyridis TaxID=115357 RepID=UPI001E278B23|nr:uncharacterized protein LOC123682722 isoform X2 [Harmonia axyridis]
MNAMNDILHNPSFKKDFAFIRQLESNNKEYQDKIWEKFIGTFNQQEDDIRIVNTRFEKHPVGFSSESDRSESNIDDEWENEASFKLSSASLELTSQKEKSTSRSVSGSKIVLKEGQRKKLHKKLTKHLERGTLDKFEVKDIGDHANKNSKSADSPKKSPVHEEKQDVFSESESSSSVDTPKTLSEVSLKEEKPNPEKKEQVAVPSVEKMSEEIERLKAKLKETQKIGNKAKTKSTERKAKSPKTKESKKVANEVNATTELRKSKYYIEKCIGVIKDISVIMNNGMIPPDGSEDYARRQVRTKEFTSRFARIYLYPLFTQLSKLGGLEKSASNFSKFTSLYQLTFQALQACFNHIPNTVGTTAYNKLRDCLSAAIDICEKSQAHFEKGVNYDNEDYVMIFKSQCLELSQKIKDNFLSLSVDSLLYSKSTRTSLLPNNQNNKNMVQNNENQKNLQKRFSMYNTNLALKRDKQWRKMLAAFEEKKPKVKSRYRTATFKHRPPVEKINSQIVEPTKQHRLDDKRSLVLLRNTPVVTPINEDNIETMIQFDNEHNDGNVSEKEALDEREKEEKSNTTFFVQEENQKACGGALQQEDILTKLLQLVQDNDQKNPADIDANLTNTIMVLQKCLSFKNQNSEMLKKMETKEMEPLTVQNDQMEILPEVDTNKQKKEPTVTVTGTKNAQLICIKDDNSIVSIMNENSTSQGDSPESIKKSVKSAEVQTSQSELIEEAVYRLDKSRSNIKINRVKRPRRMLQLLPKEYAINIIQYKLMFYKHHKGNYMYKKTSTTKPWQLMDKISEDIFDYALLGIAKEIEVNELLENIYNAEFQY